MEIGVVVMKGTTSGVTGCMQKRQMGNGKHWRENYLSPNHNHLNCIIKVCVEFVPV